MLSRQRIQTPDLLKGIAVILMIQVHIMELFIKQGGMDGPVGMASLFLGGTPAAPVFMILMGYFLAYGRKSSAIIRMRGVKLFIAGMLLNAAINAHLVYKVLFAGWGASVNIWNYLFGVDILHLAGLSLMVLSSVIPMFKERLPPYLIMIALVLLIPYFVPPHAGDESLPGYLLAFVYSKASWSYFPLFPWLVYPLAGYTFYIVEKKFLINRIKKVYRTTLLWMLPFFIFFTFPYASRVMHNLEEYYHHNAVFFFWTTVFLIWWWTLADTVEQKFGDKRPLKYIKWLGIHVTSVYIFQWIIIGNIATGVYKTLPLYALAIWFILILIFTSVFTYVWNSIKSKHRLNFLSL